MWESSLLGIISLQEKNFVWASGHGPPRLEFSAVTFVWSENTGLRENEWDTVCAGGASGPPYVVGQVVPCPRALPMERVEPDTWLQLCSPAVYRAVSAWSRDIIF